MAVCSNCGCDLPGTERLCRVCYDYQYAQLKAPRRKFWQRLGHSLGDVQSFYLGILLVGASLLLYWILTFTPVWFQRGTALLASVLLWADVVWRQVSDRPRTKGWWTVLFLAILTTGAVCSMVVILGGVGTWKSLAVVSALGVTVFNFISRRIVWSPSDLS